VSQPRDAWLSRTDLRLCKSSTNAYTITQLETRQLFDFYGSPDIPVGSRASLNKRTPFPA
jgi:hypothetical protein